MMLNDPFVPLDEAEQEVAEEPQPSPAPVPEPQSEAVEPPADPPPVSTRRTWLNLEDGRRRRVTRGSAHDVRYDRLDGWEEV